MKTTFSAKFWFLTSFFQITSLQENKPSLQVNKPSLQVNKPSLQVNKPSLQVNKPRLLSGSFSSVPYVLGMFIHAV